MSGVGARSSSARSSMFSGPAARRVRGSARRAAKPSTRGGFVDTLGRVGFVGRGVVYLLIAWITLLIALNHKTLEADRTGALELVAGKPFGHIVLWFLVVGFAGMALWRAVTAARPGSSSASGRDKTGSRLASAGKAVLYAVAAYTTARFAGTGKQGQSTNQYSQDFTTHMMRNSGGRLLVGAVGAALVIAGLVMIERANKKRFVKQLRTGEMSASERHWVLGLGRAGKTARGAIVVGIGVFLVDAAVTFDPQRARGVDGTLRALAATSFGPILLILMAIGLAAFGVYSFCEARWRKL